MGILDGSVEMGAARRVLQPPVCAMSAKTASAERIAVLLLCAAVAAAPGCGVCLKEKRPLTEKVWRNTDTENGSSMGALVALSVLTLAIDGVIVNPVVRADDSWRVADRGGSKVTDAISITGKSGAGVVHVIGWCAVFLADELLYCGIPWYGLSS